MCWHCGQLGSLWLCSLRSDMLTRSCRIVTGRAPSAVGARSVAGPPKSSARRRGARRASLGMLRTPARASASHRSLSGLRVMERACTIPSAASSTKVFENRSYPKKVPSLPSAPTLPSGACRGPLEGYRYRRDSPNPTSCWPNGLPRILAHAVIPSVPLTRVFSSKVTCSSIHAMMGWSTGMYRLMRASRHNLCVRSIPLTICTPTSVPPLA